jgi:hypothetical protein
LVVVAFYEFYALIFQAKVVSVFTDVSF